jgi:hypothetical protein
MVQGTDPAGHRPHGLDGYHGDLRKDRKVGPSLAYEVRQVAIGVALPETREELRHLIIAAHLLPNSDEIELAVGLEPTTCCLQNSCSAN